MDNPDSEYLVKTAKTVEAKRLIEQGFEYVTTIEGEAIYRKRK